MSLSIRYPWDTFRRFRLKSGDEAEVLFVDGDNTEEEPIPYIKEHAFFNRDGTGPNFAPCPKENCPVCPLDLKPYNAWMFSVVRIRDAQTGVGMAGDVELLVAKIPTMQRILGLVIRHEGLVGSVWKLRMSGPKSPVVGDEWQFIRKIGGDGKMAPAERRLLVAKEMGVEAGLLKPIDYGLVSRPRSREELISEGIDVEGTRREEEMFFRGGKFRDEL